jgi:hypothetical protein
MLIQKTEEECGFVLPLQANVIHTAHVAFQQLRAVTGHFLMRENQI